ncbi:MAG: hypothetical protein RMM58_01590 [Chloroflexota bacterium]|nr:hypothetical protein [Dehalococcoidia bacterium]MDW8252552.1 hypothetical protein [Chloroflexota bacterium]
MRDLAAVSALLPAGLDPSDPLVQQAKVFDPGDPLPPGARGLDLAHPERGVFVIDTVAPRVPPGSVILTDVSCCRAVWARATGA